MVILCLCLLAAGCASPPASSARVSPDDVVFLPAPTAHGQRVGWTSFNDHLTWHYTDDAMTQMRQAAARNSANVVVLLGVDPPDPAGRFGQFEVHGFLATVYVWADLYYCPGLTNSPAQKVPEYKIPPVRFTAARSVPSARASFTDAGAWPPPATGRDLLNEKGAGALRPPAPE
jgi:hypothetical protein